MSWLDHRSKEYEEHAPDWKLASAHYRASVRELRTAEHLIQRAQAEPDEQFKERLQLADYPPLFALVADAYVGRLRSAEDDARMARDFGALGDLTDEDSAAYQLWRNADEDGSNYLTLAEDAATLLVTCHSVWGVVDAPTGSASAGQIRVIEPQAVAAWGGVAADGEQWVRMIHHKTVWDDPRKEPKEIALHRLFYTDHWEDWREPEDKGAEPVQYDEGLYGGGPGNPFIFYRGAEAAAAKDRRGRMLPIYRVRLPMRRMVGAALAAANGVFFNKLSERDNLLRVANTPKLSLVGDTQEIIEMLDAMRNARHGNVLTISPEARLNHSYISPPTDSAAIATEVLKSDLERFMLVASRQYEDSVRGAQKTATEVRQDVSRHEGTFLAKLAGAVDEFEVQALRRLEQIVKDVDRAEWGTAHVERSGNFAPLDPQAEMARIREAYFGAGETVPADEETQAEIALRIHEMNGLHLDEERRDRVREIVRQRTDAGAAERDALSGPGFSANLFQ